VKVGDLVMLSNYGLNRQFNSALNKAGSSQTGLVIDINENSSYPFKVLWPVYTGRHGPMKVGHHRREIKYAYNRKEGRSL